MLKKISVLAALLTASILVAGDFLFFSPEMIQTHLQGYTEEEKEAIGQDLEITRSICLFPSDNIADKPTYLATAGAPGARKTTTLERFVQAHPEFSSSAYIDPDQRTLKFMAHTYYRDSLSALTIASYPDYADATKAAYEKWRGGSNYIALTLLEEAFSQKRSVIHGTTSTGAHVPSFYPKLKEAGYDIVLLLCYSPDFFRKEAIEYRNMAQKFYQSTPEDALAKGKFFPERMVDYFTYADTLYFFWSDSLNTRERLAAVLTKDSFLILDPEAFHLCQEKFAQDRRALEQEGIETPSWDALIEIFEQVHS